MKPILITPFLSLAFLLRVAAQDGGPTPPPVQRPELTIAQRDAIEELNEAARTYREGKYAEAELHSENALALDPSSKTAPLFIARTVHAQYKPGDQSDANVAKAREAIGAYQRILGLDPHNEEAYKAIAFLYGAIKEDDLLRQWVLRRAIDPTLSDEQRAEAYLILGSKDWDCSFRITELPANHVKATTRRRSTIVYVKPNDVADFEKAQRCANDGLEMIEAAITLAPNSEGAWSYKANILLELARLSEMDHDLQLQTEYTNQARAAGRTVEELRSRKAANPAIKP
ncbi:MAG: hypothetical protein ABJC10_02370 [Acidobacteriota bacterium]